MGAYTHDSEKSQARAQLRGGREENESERTRERGGGMGEGERVYEARTREVRVILWRHVEKRLRPLIRYTNAALA